MLIAFDIDDTLADLVPEWLRRYNYDYHDKLTLSDITDWDITQFVKPECGKSIYDYLQASIYDSVSVVDGALKLVERARTMGRVIFVTSCHPSHAGRKFQWLNDHGFNVQASEYIECTDKSLIAADVMIDDRPANLDAFTGTHKILINKPWNQEYLGAPRVYSLADPYWDKFWREVSQSSLGTTVADLSTKAVKYDVGKPQMELLSPWVLLEVAKVMTHGAQKYSPHNWRKGFTWTRPIGACLRHISKWLMGEDLDPEWNLPHLAHAICCLMFTLEHQLLKMGTDDRWIPPQENNHAE